MSQKWLRLFLLVVFVVVGLAAGFLYLRYRALLPQQPTESPSGQTTGPARRDQNFGSAVVTYSGPSSGQKEYLRSAVLNSLIVEDLSLETVELRGKKKPLLNLTVSFDYQGVSRKLTIPLVENILLRKLAFNEFEKGELMSVESLNLKKGALLNVAFSYIPEGSTIDKLELINYCNERKFESCLKYIELGFGNGPTDFGTYLQDSLANQEPAKLDYKLVFPDILFQRTD